MTSAQKQVEFLPAVRACDRMTGELDRLREMMDVMPFEFQQLLPYSHLESAKALIEMAGEQVKKIALG